MGISFDHDCFSGSSGVFFVSGNYGKRFMKFNEAGYRKLLAFISNMPGFDADDRVYRAVFLFYVKTKDPIKLFAFPVVL